MDSDKQYVKITGLSYQKISVNNLSNSVLTKEFKFLSLAQRIDSSTS